MSTINRCCNGSIWLVNEPPPYFSFRIQVSSLTNLVVGVTAPVKRCQIFQLHSWQGRIQFFSKDLSRRNISECSDSMVKGKFWAAMLLKTNFPFHNTIFSFFPTMYIFWSQVQLCLQAWLVFSKQLEAIATLPILNLLLSLSPLMVISLCHHDHVYSLQIQSPWFLPPSPPPAPPSPSWWWLRSRKGWCLLCCFPQLGPAS